MPAVALSRGIQALAAGRPAESLPLLRAAMQAPEQAELAALNLALACMALGEFGEARPLLLRTHASLPGLGESAFRLGVIAGQAGQPAQAAEWFTQALRRQPGHALALVGLGSLAENRGDFAAAEGFFARAALLTPEEPELAFAQARIAVAQGQAERARRHACSCLNRRPMHVAAARLLAGVLADEAALAALPKADADSPAWVLVSACMLLRAGAEEAALAALHLAEALGEPNADLTREINALLARLGRAPLPGEAAPESASAVLQRSTALWQRHEFAAMVALLRAGLAQYGPVPGMAMNLALALNAQGQHAEALAAAETAVAEADNKVVALVNRLAIMPYHPQAGRAEALLAAARAIDAALPPMPAPCPATPRRPGRLRLGVLSGGLGTHPVGWLTLAGLEHLPAEDFALTVYSLKPRPDTLNSRFRRRADAWHEVGALDDSALAARIAADDLDVLLDMGGFGEGGRPLALRGKPCRKLVKWVGSQFSTTGLAHMDAMLTDRWETPPGFERFYTERLLRLPDGYVCYTPPPYAPPVGLLPALANGHVTFGCFNNLAKLTDAVLQAWAMLLRRLPQARLVLQTHAFADAETLALTARRLAAQGLPMARLTLLSGCPHPEFLANYARIDIALDPFPYSGGLTVCEALWMGVPVVALASDSFAGRHALSHLSNAGLPQWVATDLHGYLQRAEAAAADLPALAQLRAGLRDQVRASPLVDGPRFGRNLATALRSII